MTRTQLFAQARVLILMPVALLAAGFVAGEAMAAGPNPSDHPDQAAGWTVEVLPDRTIVEFQDPGTGRSTRSALVALPGSARGFSLELPGESAALATAPDGIQILRGTKVLRVLVESVEQGPLSLVVRHDGNWNDGMDRSAVRLLSPALHRVLDLPQDNGNKALTAGRGSYLIVHPERFTDAIAPLVEWKTRKGFPVVTVSTDDIGSSTEAIQSFLQDAYDTWDNPPEYVLLAGDVGDIPTYYFEGNPSDLAYVLLDGDDWLPDAMLGRLPVENDTQAQTLVNKIVGYERHPFVEEGTGWFTRSIMVGGVEGSETPPHTVRFCGEQLEKIGFAPAQTFLHPPLPSNFFIASLFNPALDTGASIVAYRGWAYGTSGWSDPRYEVNDMGGMNNLSKLPVVMSFVCLNGDYTVSPPCFGEAFVRLGQPDQLRGAVAFIGNGEHWSHTRYNDGMAISFFERIIDEGITDLGSLMTAGKLRFMDYFPHEMDAETYGEESVEFYFHIYNLLGDPELNFWKSTPRGIEVDNLSVITPGANHLDVTVTAGDGGNPVSGAAVTATSGGMILGSAITDAAGAVRLTFPPLEDGSSFDLTVSGAGLIPSEKLVTAAASGASLTAQSVAIADGNNNGQGNGDGLPNPGETLAVTPTLINNGSAASGAFTATFVEVQGPATATGGSLDFSNLAVGESATAGFLNLAVSPAARDGEMVTCTVDAVRAGNLHDLSVFQFTVSAPDLAVVSLAPLDGQGLVPGETFDLAVTLQAEGTAGTAGGSISLELVSPTGAALLSSNADFGACPAGEVAVSSEDISLQLDSDLATGTNLAFTATITTEEGYTRETSCALVVGPVNVTTVCGPDPHGYYAYDSADLDYPANRPQYQWNEISPAMGGEGTRLEFPVDNEMINVLVELPFAFTFYGVEYPVNSAIRVCDNGWIAFDLAPNFNFYNWPMPSEHGNNAVVAPFWENLVPSGDGGANGLAPDGIYHDYDPAAGTFTIEWSRLHHYQPEILGYQTFQVVLLDPAMHPTTSGDGQILFYYREVNNNDYLRNYATVGIEDADGREGMQLSYAGFNESGMAPLQPGLAVRLTTEPPVRVPFTLSSFTAREEAGTVRLEWSPSDDRPVLGWLVDRVDKNGTSRITESPLAGSTRAFTVTNPEADGQEGISYRLTAMHPYGTNSQPGEVTLSGSIGLQLALHKVSPNPATGSTNIAFVLPEDSVAQLRVYDAAGRLVRTLVDGPVPAGEGMQSWDGRDDRGASAAGGVYFFRLETRGKTLTRKMMLVR